MFNAPRTFACPNCKEIVNEAMTMCRFCSVPIDPGIAAIVAERQQLANQAYSDASSMRISASAMFVFLAVGVFLTIGYVAFLVTFLATTAMLIRWQLRFGNLLTSDPDYESARKFRNVTAILLLVGIPAGIIASPFIKVIIQMLADIISMFD